MSNGKKISDLREPRVIGYMPDHSDGEPLITLESHQAYVEELRALLEAPVEPVEVVQADNADQALTLLGFALSFALCNMDHGGTRRDVKKAQAHLESYCKFKAAQPQGEPVAYRYKEGHAAWESEKPWEPTTLAHGAVLLERKALAANGTFRANELEYYSALTVEPLYAEQPAPVAADRMCDCNQGLLPCTCIPDFTPGSGNRARRRAEAIEKGCSQPQAHPARCGCKDGN